MPNITRRQFLNCATVLPLTLILPINSEAAYSKRLNGVIRELEGEVYINKRLASINSKIATGDMLSVAHRGRLIFSMADDTYLLQGGSSLSVESQDSIIVSGLRLLTGGLLAVFGKRRNTTKIYTRTATIGIRGTGVYLNSSTENLYFCTCYGNTDLHLGHNHTEHIQATHHNAFEISGSSEKTMSMKATQVLGHSDDELRLLEQYSGRKPAFDF